MTSHEREYAAGYAAGVAESASGIFSPRKKELHGTIWYHGFKHGKEDLLRRQDSLMVRIVENDESVRA